MDQKELSHKESYVKDEESSATSKEDPPVVAVSADDGGTTTFLLTPAADRALVWKFDLRILPVLAIMYLFNSLDKSNLGNAKTAGLEKTLKLHGTQYNTILSVFFVPYVLTAPFLGILGKKLGPNRVLPAMMFSFGCFTVLVTAVMNFGGLMTIRWFLGMSESAFFPLVIYYLTTYGLFFLFSLSPPFLSLNHLYQASHKSQILPPRRTSPPPRHLLRCPKHRLCIRRPPRVWRLSNQDGRSGRLALPLHRRRLLHRRLFLLRLLVPTPVRLAGALPLPAGKRPRLLPHANRLLLYRQRKIQPARFPQNLQTSDQLADSRNRDLPRCALAVCAAFLAADYWPLGV